MGKYYREKEIFSCGPHCGNIKKYMKHGFVYIIIRIYYFHVRNIHEYSEYNSDDSFVKRTFDLIPNLF